MDSTTTYHHYRTDPQLYNVVYHRYINRTTTYHHCTTDLHLYNVLRHGYMDPIYIYGTDLQQYNVLYHGFMAVVQPIITIEHNQSHRTFQ